MEIPFNEYKRLLSGVSSGASNTLEAMEQADASEISDVRRFYSQNVRALSHRSISMKAMLYASLTGGSDPENFCSQECISYNAIRLPSNRWVNLRNFLVQNQNFSNDPAVVGQVPQVVDYYIAVLQCSQNPFTHLETGSAMTSWQRFENGFIVDSNVFSGVTSIPFADMKLLPVELGNYGGYFPQSGAIPTARSYFSLGVGNAGILVNYPVLAGAPNYYTDGPWRIMNSFGNAKLVQILSVNQSNASYLGLEPWVYGMGDYLMLFPFFATGGQPTEPGVIGVSTFQFSNRILFDMYY